MAGYVKMYMVGSLGGVDGVDGIGNINLVIGVGASDREWLRVLNQNPNSNPFWKLKTIIPDPQNYENSIIDAVIAFAPELFKECSELKLVAKQLGTSTRISFDSGPVPESWEKLREQARPIFEKIAVFESPIVELRGKDKYPSWD